MGVRSVLCVALACATLGASTPPLVHPPLAQVLAAEPVRLTVALAPLYPWGTDHNGTARMYPDMVTTDAGVTTITAVRDLTLVPPVSSHREGGKNIPVHYRSGAVHSTEPVVIAARQMVLSVEAQLPSARGTWPAIWLTGVDSWPPEIDLAEYMGSTQALQNVFSTTRRNAVHMPSRVVDSEAWHEYRAVLTPYTNGDVLVEFSIDGLARGSVVANALVGKKLWLIANLQMEQWAGSPGPDRAVMRLRKLTVNQG